MVGEEPPRTAAKRRRLKRSRRLTQVGYWTAWAVGGLVFLLLLVGGIVGFAAGQ